MTIISVLPDKVLVPWYHDSVYLNRTIVRYLRKWSNCCSSRRTRWRKRKSEQEQEEGKKEATSRLLLLGGSDESSEHHLLENSNMGQNQKATGPISTWYCSSKIALMFSKYSTLNSISCFVLITRSCRHNRQKEDGLNVERMTKSYGGAQKRLKIQ